MLGNYLKIAIRNLLRHRAFSLINIAGLSVGMACAFLTLGTVRFELTYDRHHADVERIYRIIRMIQKEPGGSARRRLNTGPALLPLTQGQVPGIEHAARLYDSGGIVAAGDRRFVQGAWYFADPAIFQVLSLPLLEGSPATALNAPHTVLLTPEMARKYFGDESPMGRTLQLDGTDYRVTGVLEEQPANAHFHPRFLASFASLASRHRFYANWDDRTWTYLKLAPGQTPQAVEAALAPIAQQHMDTSSYHNVELVLQRLVDIHFQPGGVAVEMGGHGDEDSLILLAILGAAILAIAGINFVNLSTARSAKRAREVGVRKAVGSRRGQLAGQFLGESILISLVAMAVALLLVEAFLPAFRAMVGKEVALSFRDEPVLLLLMGAIALLVGALAGTYPALLLSGFRPAHVLKGDVTKNRAGIRFRRGLVVLQFALSVGLIVCTVVMHQQRRFLATRHLGFDREHVVYLPLHLLADRLTSYPLLKQELLSLPGVESVTASVNKPGVTDNKGIQIRLSGAEEDHSIGIVYVDHDYVENLRLELAAGRDFSAEIDADAHHVVMLNESAVESLGEDFGLGASVELFWRSRGKVIPQYEATVIGVLKDYNHRPYSPAVPLVFAVPISGWGYQHALVRIGPGQTLSAVDAIGSTWKRLFPDLPFRFSFLDDDIQAVYRAEQQWERVLTYVAGLAVFVACLGLFGLASFSAEQRTREIGVRKTLGASVTNVVLLLSREFTALVVAANLIAWPVTYWFLRDWLQHYHYRIDLGVGVFLLSGMVALVVAWLTVSSQAVRAGRTNPVEALRYE